MEQEVKPLSGTEHTEQAPDISFADPFAEIKAALENRIFDSTEEGTDFVRSFFGEQQRKTTPDFLGLSPNEMHAFLYSPFSSPDLVTFPEVLSSDPTAPIITLFELLRGAIGEKGLKATEKGNLPRAFCREAAPLYWGAERFAEYSRYATIYKETDLFDLWLARTIFKETGLLTKRHGRFFLTKKCRNLLDKNGTAAIYPILFKAFIQKYNWGYRDYYPEYLFIQQSFLFSLYVMYRAGNGTRPHEYYEDAFLQAFPVILREPLNTPWTDPAKTVRGCYSRRVLHTFASYLGLIDIKPTDEGPFHHQYNVTVLPLLKDAVRFHF
jgi:hypothetical protein